MAQTLMWQGDWGSKKREQQKNHFSSISAPCTANPFLKKKISTKLINATSVQLSSGDGETAQSKDKKEVLLHEVASVTKETTAGPTPEGTESFSSLLLKY